MAQSLENIQLSLGQKWLNEYCGTIPDYQQVPEDGGYGTVGQTIIAVLTAIQKNIGVSTAAIVKEYTPGNPSHVFGNETKALFGEYSLSASTDFSDEYNLNMLKALQIGLWCKGINPGSFGVFSEQTTGAINELMSRAGINASGLDGVASRMVFIAISTEVSFRIPAGFNGSERVRNIQLMINGAYAKEREFLIPCDGIKAESTIAGFLYYYQRTVGLSAQEAQNAYGLYNTQTYNLSPILEEGSSNTQMITLLQDSLYLNNGYNIATTGIFDASTKNIIQKLQVSVGLPSTGIVDKITWGYVLESCGYQEIAPTVCDTSMILGPNEIKILTENNINMVGRYLTAEFAMTQEELEGLLQSNIAVIPLFEYGASVSYFTFEQGQEDAFSAVLAAEKLKIPADNSVTIYFAVDTDISLGDLESNVTEYFRGVFTKIKDARLGYNIGVYGARYTCTYLLEKGYVTSSYVASSSYEFKLNMGYPMPSRWGFNQYSTMNINSSGAASEIFLDGVIPIDKVTRSGYDHGIVRLTNGIGTSSAGKSTEPKSIAKINEDNYPVIKEVAKEIFSNLLNIKSPNLADYINKPISKKIKDRINKPWVYFPPNECAYMRGDFGIKAQAGAGSVGTLYFNKNEDSWSASPTLDLLPQGFGGNFGSNFNFKTLDEANFKKSFKSLMPTYSKTVDIDNTEVGLQFYSCWNGNLEAKKGYWEVGVEIGFNVGGGKFADIPTSLYYFVDIIIGVRDTWMEKLLDTIESKVESTFESVSNFISKTINNISESGAEIIEAEGSEATLEFSEGTPELFETIGELSSATSDEIAMSAWGDFITMLEPLEGDLITAAIIAVCC